MKRSIRVSILAATVFALVGGLFVAMTTQARAAGDLTLYVNSNAPGFPAASTTPAALAAMCPLGDAGNVYPPSGSANTCTLGAALTIANANSTAADPYTVTLADGFAADAPADGWVIVPTAVSQAMMSNATTAANDANKVTRYNADAYGAYYAIKAPMTVDLQNKLGIVSSATLGAVGASIYITGAGPIELLNASNIVNNTTAITGGRQSASIIVGATADGVRISGGKTMPKLPTSNGDNNFHVFLTINDGARNVTFTNYVVGNLYQGVSSACASAAVCFAVGTDTATTTLAQNIKIENVTFTSDGGAYHAIILFQTSKIKGLTITGNTFENLIWATPVPTTANATVFDAWTNPGLGGLLEDLDFSKNKVVNSSTLYGSGTSQVLDQNNALVKLPPAPLGGVNYIRDNEFAVPVSLNAYHAVGWAGPSGTSGGAPSNLYIRDNTFSGFVGPAIYLNNAGMVTVERNLFLAETYSNSGDATLLYEESGQNGNSNASASGAMYVNQNSTANEKIRTWYPTGDPKVGIVDGTCSATFSVAQPPTAPAATFPQPPVRIDVYYTQEKTAEVFLGSSEVVSSSPQELTMKLPNKLINASGDVDGYLRVQTQAKVGVNGDQLESSQYSRVVKVSGSCAPKLTIERVSEAPTLARDLTFELTSTAPLNLPAESEALRLAFADFLSLAVTPVTDGDVQTIDASRINERMVSVEQVGDTFTKFRIVFRVDDTADLAVSVPLGAVQTAQGWTNAAAATSTTPDGDEAKIRFINPLRVSPEKFILLTGEPTGKDFTISIADGAPTPTAELSFRTTVVQPAGNSTVTLSDENPTLPAGAISETTVTVTASAGAVAAGTAGKIRLAVTSSDVNYDGLVLPDVTPRLFAEDPFLKVEKHAFVGGVEVPFDAPLIVGDEICFKYTVTNISTSEWATTLTNVQVRDTDTRLGPNEDGLIATIEELLAGESLTLDGGCVPLEARDTTAEGSRR